MHGAEQRLEKLKEKERKRLERLEAQPDLDLFSRTSMEPWAEGWGGWDDRTEEQLEEDAERSISLLGSEMDGVLFADEIPVPERSKKRRERRRKVQRKVVVKPRRKR